MLEDVAQTVNDCCAKAGH